MPFADIRSIIVRRSVGASFRSASARSTTRFGKKLETVCSVQPYG